MNYKIYNRDCLEAMREMESGSCQMICTDIPYGVEFASEQTTYDDSKEHVLNTMGVWIAEWYRVLADDSYAFVFTGVKNIENWIIEAKKAGFTFKNMIATRTFNNGSMCAKNFAFVFQPVLVFSKGIGRKFHEVDFFPTSPEWLKDKRNKNPKPYTYQYPNFIPTDICYGSEVFGGGAGANFHPNAKNEDLCRFFIEIATDEGETVLDPFTGCGTTGAAAVSVGRRFVGCEIDPHWAKTAEERIAGNVNWKRMPKPGEGDGEGKRATQLELGL